MFHRATFLYQSFPYGGGERDFYVRIVPRTLNTDLIDFPTNKANEDNPSEAYQTGYIQMAIMLPCEAKTWCFSGSIYG